MKPRELVFVVLVGLLIVGCQNDEPPHSVVKREGNPDAFNVRNDDAALIAAKKKARDTVSDFIAALRAPRPGDIGFSVKVPVTEGEGTEHLWLGDVTFDGSQFHGTINNNPVHLQAVKLGDKRSVSPSELSDWMYIADGVLKGGYTIRMRRDAMSPVERAEFDRNRRYKVE